MQNLKTIFFLLIFLISTVINAKVKAHGAFTNGMVIQQKTKVPVWGWANPNEKITVLGSWGKSATAYAKADSTWQVMLKSPKAGGPFQITISGDNKIVIDDVLSGEVWLCTGQSNMDFEMYRFLNNARESKYQPLVEEIRKEVATANDPYIRHLEVPRVTSMYTKNDNFKAHWRTATTGHVDTITATGYYFAKELRKYLDVPIGLVECAWGGSRIQPWLSEETYMENNAMKDYFLKERQILEARIQHMETPGWQDTAYQRKRKLWLSNKKKYSRAWPTEHPKKSKQTPATIYNGMLSAIMPYKVKGILWYQGESNSHFKEDEYLNYFTAMVKAWRKDWDDKNLPFYSCQLASYIASDERSDVGWAIVSDHIRRGLKLPNTGMAVLNDIGEARDVHPHNKMDAGKRLSLWALKNEYKQDLPAVSGPLFKKLSIKKGALELKFSNVGSGLMVAEKTLNQTPVKVDKPLRWFEIAGDDNYWKPANAEIVAKNKLKVWSADVKHPTKVRYAWSSNPEGVNFYNKEGLPAATFISE